MLVVLAAVCSLCHAQDSIVVIDRGMPPPRVWAVLEAPFKVLEVPFRLAGAGVGWVASRAEAGGWVPALRRLQDTLEAHGIRPWVSSQGPNSGVGPELRLGAGFGPMPTAWAHLRGAVTLREYWLAEARLGLRFAPRGRPASLETFARLEDRPKDPFFGLGNESRESDWSDYALRRSTIGSRIVVGVPARIVVRLGVDWSRVETARGRDDAVPDIDSTFAPAERPGFGAAHRSVVLAGGAEWSAGARHSSERRGSWVALRYRWRVSRSAGVPDDGVLSANAGVELPFDHRRRSVALAVYLESLRPQSAGVPPFYLLPTLGGAQSLPAFRSDRFRDRDVLVTKLEYRYRVWSHPADAVWADAVVFTSRGMVAERLEELALSRLHGITGAGLALIARGGTLARLAVSGGSDGVGVSFSFGTTF